MVRSNFSSGPTAATCKLLLSSSAACCSLHYTEAPRSMRASSIRSGAMSRSLLASHCTISETTTQQRTWMAESGGHCSITVRICSLSSSNISCGVVHCIFHVSYQCDHISHFRTFSIFLKHPAQFSYARVASALARHQDYSGTSMDYTFVQLALF